MLLCLDELHQANPEDVDQAIYMLANGVSKIRGSKEGFAAKTNRWRVGFLLVFPKHWRKFKKQCAQAKKHGLLNCQ